MDTLSDGSSQRPVKRQRVLSDAQDAQIQPHSIPEQVVPVVEQHGTSNSAIDPSVRLLELVSQPLPESIRGRVQDLMPMDWRQLPFSNPRQIHLKIVLVFNDRSPDNVCYCPESDAYSPLLVAQNDTGVCLTIPHEAAVATIRGETGREPKGILLFGNDIKDAQEDQERYVDVQEFWSESSPNHFLRLMDLLGPESKSAVLIKNVFDKSEQNCIIQSCEELESRRTISVVETVKRDFMIKSGLSVAEVQDIFLNRTNIRIVLDTTDKLARGYDRNTYWQRLKGMGFPTERLTSIQRVEAWAFFLAANRPLLKWRMNTGRREPDSTALSAVGKSPMATLVVSNQGPYAGACIIESFPRYGWNGYRIISPPTESIEPRWDLKNDIRAMMETAYSEKIGETAPDSVTYLDESFAQALVTDFFKVFGEFTGAADVKVPLSSQEYIKREDGFMVTELLIKSGDVVSMVSRWLKIFMAVAKKHWDILYRMMATGTVLLSAHRQIMMTGGLTRNNYIVHAFREALVAAGIRVDVVWDPTIESSPCAAQAALWSMVVCPRSSPRVGQMPDCEE